MARYRFAVIEGANRIGDDDEIECATIDEAGRQAVAGLRDIAACEVLQGHLNMARQVEVTDGTGAVVATISAADVLQLDDEAALSRAARHHRDALPTTA